MHILRKENDIAVLTSHPSASVLLKLQALLKAEPIDAIYESKAGPFFNKLVPSWKQVLKAEYGH